MVWNEQLHTFLAKHELWNQDDSQHSISINNLACKIYAYDV